MADVCVQPVAIRSPLFCVICSFCMCVAAVAGFHAGCTYFSMGLMFWSHTIIMSSLDWLYNVLVCGRWTLRRFLTLKFMFSVCVLNDMPLSYYVFPSVVLVLV